MSGEWTPTSDCNDRCYGEPCVHRPATPNARKRMDDRVHARLVATGLDCGMVGDEALAYADSRMGSIEGDGIRLGLAVDDLRAATIEPLATWVIRKGETVSEAVRKFLERYVR